MVIAIDGPAGSGKSAVAQMLSERLGLTFMNTGSFYRALALAAIRSSKKLDLTNEKDLIDLASHLELNYIDSCMYIGQENVEPYLRSDSVEAIVAQISSIISIRRIINEKIRSAVPKNGIVCEGRDMTTVVFPDADAKFYLDASIDIRAQRRFKQGTSNLSIQEIKESLKKRDTIDKNKNEGSLQLADDATYFDTSDLTIMQVCENILCILYNKGLFMEDLDFGKDVKNAGENIHAQLQEEYLNSFEAPEVGTIKDGRVVAINNGTVFVDVGGKSEGHISLDEFKEEPKINDTVRVLIERTESQNGALVISKQKADKIEGKHKLNNSYKNHEPVAGTIIKLIKKGYEVKLEAGFIAFLPMSQADTVRIEKPEILVGQESEFYIEKISFNKKNGENIVVNRRKYLEDRIETARNSFFANAQIGDVVKGSVKTFTHFGAFVDLGGFDGLLHVNDISWGHVIRPKDFVKKGDEIEFKIIRLDPENKRINLSLKHFTPDPWLDFENKFHVGDVVSGTVTKVTDFGAFIELSEGIEGLAHISEFSWVRKVDKPADVVKTGDKIECMVLGYDIQAGRVSLGLKQVTQNPWDHIEEKYAVGTRLVRKVVKITNAGAFIELEDGIDGFLHVDDISWIKRIKYPGTVLEVNQEIEVIVLESNAETRRIRLGIKQLTDNPWDKFIEVYKVGALVEGDVTSITDFGLFIKVPGDIEGLIHKQNLVENRDDNPDEVLAKYTIGDKVKAVVIEINQKTKKAAFSVRDLKKREHQEELSRYIASGQEDNEISYTLGDIYNKK